MSLSAIEKVETLKGDVSFPRAAVVSASAVPSGMAELHGMRVGTGPAVVLDLADHQYQRIVITVDNPQQVIASLTQ